MRLISGDPPRYKTDWPLSVSPLSLEQLYARQMFLESAFDPRAKSPVGAMGIAQFMPGTVKDMTERFGFEEGWDPYDPQLAREAQERYMMSLLGGQWNKGDQEVKLAKALGAYNYGVGNMLKFLEKEKAAGKDIYTSTDWVNDLNPETKQYIKGILYGFDDNTRTTESAFKQKLPKYLEFYPQRGEYFGMTVEKPQQLNRVQEQPKTPVEKASNVLDPRLENAFKILKKDNPKYPHGGRHGEAAASSTAVAMPQPPREYLDMTPTLEDVQNRSVYEIDRAGLPSTFDTAFEYTGADDLTQIIASLINAKDGNYAQAVIAPLLMVLPPSLGKRLQTAIKQVDDLPKVPDWVNAGAKAQHVGAKQRPVVQELNDVAAEIMAFRRSNPEAVDQAMMEMAPNIKSSDKGLDQFFGERQRALGYTGSYGPQNVAGSAVGGKATPMRDATSDLLGGPPIALGDMRGMAMLAGTPSERAVVNALRHQSHGSSPGTGNLSAAEMQRMASDIDLHRVPIPGAKYSVVRGSDPMSLQTTQMREGDIITSLSQQSGGRYGGGDRLVSTSPQGMEDLYATFGDKSHWGAPDLDWGPDLDVMLQNLPTHPKFKKLKPEQQKKLMNYASEYGGNAEGDEVLLDMLSAHGFDDVVDAINPKPSMSMNLFAEDDLLDYDAIGGLPDITEIDPRNTSFKIVKTAGMPAVRPQLYYPNRAVAGAFGAEDEVSLAAKQAFRVLGKGEESGVPLLILQPELGKRFKYVKGGKYKIKKS